MKKTIRSAQSKIIVLLITILSTINGTILGFLNRPNNLNDDAYQYATIAQNITKQGIFSLDGIFPTMIREPLYPLFIAIFSRLSNNIIIPVIIGQILLFVILCLIVYYLISSYHKKMATTAALSIAVMPPLAYYTGQILTEILFTFFLIVSILLLIKGIEKHHYLTSAGSGILFGFAILTRSIIVLFPPFFFLVMIIFLKRYWKPALIFFTTSYLIMLPWSLRNYYHFKTFSPTAGGSHLLLVRALRTEYSPQEIKQLIHYSTIGSTSSFEPTTVYGDEAQYLFAFQRARDFATYLKKQGYTEGQIDKLQLKAALEKIKKHPFIYLAYNSLETIKLNAPPISTFHTIISSVKSIDILIALLYLFLYITAVLATSKILRIKNHPLRIMIIIIILLVVYYNLILSFFDAIPRYNVPLLPFYLILLAIFLTTHLNPQYPIQTTSS